MGRKILALEPYLALSHRTFLEGLRAHSRHRVEIESLPPRKWKWRMRTASLHYAASLAEAGARGGAEWDLLFASDFVNLAELRGILPRGARDVPAVVYFHENQLTYPLQDHVERDFHFALTHVHAMLAAEWSVFNSEHHRSEFLTALPDLLRLVPDVKTDWVLGRLAERSSVLPLGIEFEATAPRAGGCPSDRGPPVLLWNHRWEYDKNPSAFLKAMRELVEKGVDFRLMVLGESFRTVPGEFRELEELLGPRLERMGFLPDRNQYFEVLRGGDIVLSTADHEFFGLGTLEAIRSGLLPVLPHDLAYPELLPTDLRTEPFLYEREAGIVPSLMRAIDIVVRGDLLEARQRIVAHTERFRWSEVVGGYDALFETVIGGAHG